jgi:hypothetical protein
MDVDKALASCSKLTEGEQAVPHPPPSSARRTENTRTVVVTAGLGPHALMRRGGPEHVRPDLHFSASCLISCKRPLSRIVQMFLSSMEVAAFPSSTRFIRAKARTAAQQGKFASCPRIASKISSDVEGEPD